MPAFYYGSNLMLWVNSCHMKERTHLVIVHTVLLKNHVGSFQAASTHLWK